MCVILTTTTTTTTTTCVILRRNDEGSRLALVREILRVAELPSG
jgi:hypothetical protein